MSPHIVRLLVSTGLAAIALSPGLTRRLPRWVRALTRIVAFMALTGAVANTLGSPFAPNFGPPHGVVRLWAQLIEAAWIASVAALAVASVRLVVVLEGKPRETRIVSDLIAGAIFICAALAIANQVLDLPVRGLLATSGVFAIVLGLALQSTLADVFSGIAVGIERPYKPGDLLWVEGGVEGVVLEVNWRSTQLGTGHRNVAIIPNSVIAKARLVNRSAPTPLRSDSITVRLDASVPPERCIPPLQAASLTCRSLESAVPPTVRCTGLAGDGNSYEIGFVVASSAILDAARSELFREIHRHLRYAGIALAVPSSATVLPAARFGIDELLADCELFGVLPESERRMLGTHFHKLHIKRGETPLHEGEMIDGLFIMASGVLELTRESGGERVVLYRAGPGETAGALGFISQKPSMATATALTDVDVYRLDTANLRDALAVHPELSGELEAMASRGSAILRLEVSANDADEATKPDLFGARIRTFLKRLSA